MIFNNEHKLFRAVYRLCTLYTAKVNNACLPHHPCPAGGSIPGPTGPEAIALPLSHGPPASCYISSNSVQRRSFEMFLPIGGQDSDLGFPIDPKNTRVVEDLDFLLPIDFRSAASEENF